jgi:hypothetical protein
MAAEGSPLSSAFCIYFGLDDLDRFGKSQMSSFLENAMHHRFEMKGCPKPSETRSTDQKV